MDAVRSRHHGRLLASPVARLVRGGLRAAGYGATSLPGRVALMLDPDFLDRARAYRRRIIVTGTNGKTSTVALTAQLLRSAGQSVVANDGGANLRQGLATTLIDRAADTLLLEVDELTLPRVITRLAPDLVAVTGLFRDQLDRAGEVTHVRDSVQAALAAVPDATLILNGDDPLTASLEGSDRRFFRLGQLPLDVPGDCPGCPKCGTPLHYRRHYYAQLGDYACPGCGFAAPPADAAGVAADDGFTFNGRMLPPLPASLHPYSVLASLAVADALGVTPRVAAWPEPVPGRGGNVAIAGRRVTVVLGKNPASVGWNLVQHRADAHLFLINDRAADGHDVSWLWDVDLATVRHAFTAGDRARDMLIRLRYAPSVKSAAEFTRPEDAFAAALRKTPAGGHLVVLATYTQLATAIDLARPSDGTLTARNSRPGIALPDRPAPAPRPGRPVRIALLLPDQLGTYGDTGNATVLARRLAWRGIAAEITRVAPGERVPAGADIILLGGGEDVGQQVALDALKGSAADLAAMAADGVPALLVCGGMQLYGESLTLAGRDLAGLGLLPIETRPGPVRLVGRLRIASPLTPAPLVGFENHAGRTRLHGDARPLGQVLEGNGNAEIGSEDEGVMLGRIVGTYLHGPVLARNPGLADILLGWIAERRGWGALAPLDDRLEAGPAVQPRHFLAAS